MDEAALDAALGRQRLGRHGCLPGLPTLVPTLLLMPVYALPALLILSPVFVDDGVAEELLGGATAEAKFKLASVSSAFFAVWGPATLAVSALSDRVGRKPAMLGCAAASSALSFGCAAAPSFAVYAACRACLGGAVGGMGAISYLLATEWSVRADALLLTTALMCGWSLVAAGLAPLAAASSARGGDWRDLQLTISLIQLAAIATGGLALECLRAMQSEEARAHRARRGRLSGGGGPTSASLSHHTVAQRPGACLPSPHAGARRARRPCSPSRSTTAAPPR